MALRRVALLIETSRQYGRDFLRGVIQYQREHGPWSIYYQPHGFGEPPPTWLARFTGDGILARIATRSLAQAVLRTGVPAVDLRSAIADTGIPGIGFDNALLVDLAFDHLYERGFRRLAFCGIPRGQNDWIDDRRQRFAAKAEAAGLPCDIFYGQRGQSHLAKMNDERPAIAAWLKKLPKPVGLFACNDDRGQQVLDACLQAGVRSPDEVAVVGADNDEFLCNLAQPRLTSIEMNIRQAGYEASALLDRLMSGERPPKGPIWLRASRLIARESTDAHAVADPELAAALQFIREQACRPISVADVVRAMHVSRRVLERRFREQLGRSPNDEILRLRLERAKLLLVESELPVAQIAERTGFATTSYFCHLFRKKCGLSPGDYRQTHAR